MSIRKSNLPIQTLQQQLNNLKTYDLSKNASRTLNVRAEVYQLWLRKASFKDVNFSEGTKCVPRPTNKASAGFETLPPVMAMYEPTKSNIKKHLGCYKFYKGVTTPNEENALYHMDDHSQMYYPLTASNLNSYQEVQ